MMNRPSRSEFWTLTVHFYPHAVAAGVEPIEVCGWPDDHQNPAYYRSHSFHFDKPPSRADFLAACRGWMPWTDGWGAIEVIENGKCDWPMVDCMHKASHADILDEAGRDIGRLKIDRGDIYRADGYDRTTIAVTCDILKPILNRVPADRRLDADLALIRAQDRIQERIAALPYEEQTREAIAKEVRAALVDAGFLGKGSRKKQEQANANA